MTVPQDNSPAIFGKYRIVGRIAVGGMAELYKARVEGLGGFSRTYAIKRILPHLATKTEFVEMLVDEAKIAGLLSHANIVQILDLGQTDGTYYIAMEYVDGPDLSRVLERCREKGLTIPAPYAVFIAMEVLKALEYAHTRMVARDGQQVPLNIVHRDIAPANILISQQGEVKLTDFGIAKASVKALETLSGVIKGRFDYMSPEQAHGKTADPRSDLFSLGVCLYEMLTGRNPFNRPREAESIIAIRQGVFTPASEVNPDVLPGLEAVLTRALVVDPDQRFASATEMKDALARFVHEAGFLFSNGRLASFIQGLFPEDQPVRPAEAPRRPLSGPTTRPAERPPRPNMRPQPVLQDAPDLTPDLDQDFGEARTVIRSVAELDALSADPVPTVASPAPEAAPPATSPAASSVTSTAPPLRAQTPARAAPVEASPPPPPLAELDPVARSPIFRLALVAAAFALVALAASVGFLLGTRYGPPAYSAAAAAPRIIARLPDGAQIQIDGVAAPAALSPEGAALSAGQPHTVRLSLADKSAIDSVLTLSAGEVRYLYMMPTPTTPAP